MIEVWRKEKVQGSTKPGMALMKLTRCKQKGVKRKSPLQAGRRRILISPDVEAPAFDEGLGNRFLDLVRLFFQLLQVGEVLAG